jgi:tetratricopeptide (TPR) repeat protein
LVEGWALLGLAEVAGEHGDANQAAMYLRDAEARFRELGHGLKLAEALNQSSYLALRQENYGHARRLIDEAMALARESAGPSAVAGVTYSLGDVLRASGDVPGAAVQYRDALVLAQEAGDGVVTRDSLTGLAGLAADTGRYQAASRLFGAIEALRETVSIQRSPYEEEQRAQDMTVVREALGPEVDADARAAGRALPLQTAVSEALALADEIASNAEHIGLRDSTG